MNKKARIMIQGEIERLVSELTMDKGINYYEQQLKQIDILNSLLSQDSNGKISKDALLAAGVSILSILIIVNYEHAHCLTSKALGFVSKGRV